MKALVLTTALLAAGSVALQAEDQISIVGSSTVYPFSSYVAEEFGEATDFKAPKVESTGSGGGHKLFYVGVGLDTPSITNSSRRMKPSELEENIKNGNSKVFEAKIGFDGIAMGQNKGNPAVNLTIEQIALAVFDKVPVDGKLVTNPYKKWSDIDKSLPDRTIKILGPPTTSGTRDAFHELVLHEAAEALGYEDAADGKEDGKVKYQAVRQDGAWVDSGENDNLIVQQLTNDKNAFGIFGYSFLAENSDKIGAANVNGVAPKPDTISSGEYPVSRSLFFYVKLSHLEQIEGLEEFVYMFLMEEMIGPDGVLKERGLISLPEAEREQLRENWEAKKTLTARDFD
ncbi:MAG: phosphate-binding protein [Verrucomicrobiales bacterium]|nr:phosphate-binding protein [Verrucomicrobiales bacterium]